MNNPRTVASPRTLAIGGFLLASLPLGMVASHFLYKATQAKQEKTRQEISVVLAGISSDDQGKLRRALELVRQHEERLRLKTGQNFHFSISIDGKLLATGPYGKSGSSTTVPLEGSKDQNN